MPQHIVHQAFNRSGGKETNNRVFIKNCSNRRIGTYTKHGPPVHGPPLWTTPNFLAEFY